MATHSTDDEPADDLIGQTVGKYSIVRVIGAGGMGKVYEGVHEALGKRAALKFIDRESANEEAVERFMREAQAASAIESAHIVEVFDIGTTEDGRPFMVMELMRGEDLGQRIRRLGRLDVPEALKISAQLLRGLARAHDAGIVHRDLKPENVFLLERDDDPCFAKILDFGISKIQRRGGEAHTTITREGMILGTPVYMSPEQAQALSDLDARTDIFSAGAILYECLTGRPPHSGASYEQIIVKICTKDADDVRLHNPLASEGLASVVKRALARERADRYASARDMLDDLVSQSEGVLPASLGSDGMKRAVLRNPNSPGGARTLAAVSTVAATPHLDSSIQLKVSDPRRRYLAIGAASVAVFGIATAAFLGGGPTTVSSALGPAANPPVLTVIAVASGSPQPANPVADGSLDREPAASADPLASALPPLPANSSQASALPTGEAKPGPKHGGATSKTAAPAKTATPVEPPGELQLKLK